MHRINLIAKLSTPALLACSLATNTIAQVQPHVAFDKAHGQLLVQGKPFLIRGGELSNSAAGTAEAADRVLPNLARLHLNTVLMPVAWEDIEPAEGHFDFALLDHWIAVAREQHLHVVLLWFGSWKNSTSGYAPAWVKRDTLRFPRALEANGSPTDILSPLGEKTMAADAHAFAALMHHLRDTDAAQSTVLMVQVENEVGMLGDGRDRSPAANRAFAQPVPPQLIKHLTTHLAELEPPLRDAFHPQGQTWSQAFGARADEVFMAWHYARYFNAVAAAGKREYSLPLYTNAQLPAFLEHAGEYPSGGPHAELVPVYQAAAPDLDFSAPDIYWTEFESWVARYLAAQPATFVPEARLDAGPFNALSALANPRVLGFSVCVRTSLSGAV